MTPLPSPRGTVWLFPGQGMEEPRMGLALARERPRARALLAMAGDLAHVDAFRLLQRGGPALDRTGALQPVLTAVALGVVDALREAGEAPDAVAGHSLGEIAAWSAAGGITAEEALRLAALRGRTMQEVATRHDGAMLAVLGDEETCRRAQRAAADHGVVDLAAHNAPGEWVLTGERRALEVAARQAPSRWLTVSGPWHSRLMAEARTALAAHLSLQATAPLGTVFVANRTGRPVDDGRDLPRWIAWQLTHPVRWAEGLAWLAEARPRFVTVGPGRVLRGLLRKNLADPVTVLTTDGPDDLASTLTALQERTP